MDNTTLGAALAISGKKIDELKSAIEQISQTGIDASDASSGQVPVADGEGSWDWGSVSGGVSDVQVNGTSVVTSGVANIPIASESGEGVARVDGSFGTGVYNQRIFIAKASDDMVKAGAQSYRPVVPLNQHTSVFYALAKAAGADMKDIQNTTVGTYPEAQKSAISSMLNAPETISGSTPSITAKAGVRYICGEVSTLDISTPASGIVDVVFESGSTPTVLTVTPPSGMTMKWPSWFDPTSLEADKVYEINIEDGIYGAVMSWA